MRVSKKIILLSILVGTLDASGQILHPIHWSYASKKISNTEAVIFIKATIDNGWHIYSVSQKDGGPLKTGFIFLPSRKYRMIDSIDEPLPTTKYEKAFSMNVSYFEKSVIFHQKVMLTSKDAVVRGKVNFMTCNDEKCLPPDEVTFSIPIK
jgi:hypothetical protein